MRLFIRPFDVAGFLDNEYFFIRRINSFVHTPLFLQIEEAEPLRRTGQIDLSLVDDPLLPLELCDLAYLARFILSHATRERSTRARNASARLHTVLLKSAETSVQNSSRKSPIPKRLAAVNLSITTPCISRPMLSTPCVARRTSWIQAAPIR